MARAADRWTMIGAPCWTRSGLHQGHRGDQVAALVATGYPVHGINPLRVARCRERHSANLTVPSGPCSCWSIRGV